ncbi:hypothetical protein PybrP1_008521 [[Pythium] brassicae (nom. inval.)]|nr:hypothetical protein PybrP1_008521 [[Pythium] brassicae (nom. inval.)]
MVLSPTTPDRLRYEAGKGHVLSHFANLATPSAVASDTRSARVAAMRTGSSLDAVSTDLPIGSTGSFGGSFGVDTRGACDRDMEDALFGPRRSNSNNDDGEDALSRKELLDRWRLEKQPGGPHRAGACADAKSLKQQPPKRSKPSHADAAAVAARYPPTSDAGNQAADSDSAMFPMDFSPPRRNRSASSSRRSTVELDATATAARSSDSDKRTKHSAFSASFVSGSEQFSPAVSSEFLSRDLDEEEQALRAKSDKERAYLYKKTQRADRNSEIEVLRSKLRTQEQIIDIMSQNESGSLAGDSSQKKQVQSLCREVAVLMQQLGERDAIIRTLHDERDASVRVVSELKLSGDDDDNGDCGPRSGGATATAAAAALSEKRFVELQGVVESLQSQIVAMRTANDELADEKRALADRLGAVQSRFTDCQHSYEASEAQRSELSAGLQQAQEQLGQLHAQWTREKNALLAAASLDERKAAALAAERETLRIENASLKTSLATAAESKRTLAAQLAHEKAVAAETQAYVARLERELREATATVAVLSEQETHLVRVESELSATKRELVNAEGRAARLEDDVRLKDNELRAVDAQLRETSESLERRLFQAEIVRRSLHNKVMELKGNIRVFCRVRPVLEHERTGAGSEEIFSFPDYTGERRQIELTANAKAHVSYGQNGGRDAVKKYNFDFDLVFDSRCSQEDVFLEVSALVQSGKTFTMQGREDSAGYATMQPSSHMGIVGRAIAHIYATIADLRASGWEFSVSLEMIEIYNETLRDLLAPLGSGDKVDLRLDADGRPAIANACIHTVTNELNAWQLLQKAMTKRSTKATSMNDRSSRSHCVITFRMAGVNALTGDRRAGVVHLVDLAVRCRLIRPRCAMLS